MPGHIIEGTQIAVDLWRTKALVGGRAKFFFLTHLHTDHTEGLSKKWTEPIYTSPLNAELLQLKDLVSPSIVRVLQVEQSHIINVNKDETFTVSLFDANHCPGSVMFLFGGKFGNILYTGDFCNTLSILPSWLPAIDILYLDNTYCLEKYKMPTKEAAAEEVVKISSQCLTNGKLLVVGIDSLGKEDLVARIAETMQSKVYMDKKQAEVFKILGLNNVITPDPFEAKIHVRRTNEINRRNLNALNQLKQTCAILPTARFMNRSNVCQNTCPGIHVVPYSCHSSYAELRSFVEKVRPKKIIPILGPDERGFAGEKVAERADMAVFDDLCWNIGKKSVLPEKHVQGMSSDEAVEENFPDTNVAIIGDSVRNSSECHSNTDKDKDDRSKNLNELFPKLTRCTDVNKNVDQRYTEKFRNSAADSVESDVETNMDDLADLDQEELSEQNNMQKNKKRTYKFTYVDAKCKKTYYVAQGEPSKFDNFFK